MKIIAAVDEKWGIGKGMNLLFRISEDMEFLKRKQWVRRLLWAERRWRASLTQNRLKIEKMLYLQPTKISSATVRRLFTA